MGKFRCPNCKTLYEYDIEYDEDFVPFLINVEGWFFANKEGEIWCCECKTLRKKSVIKIKK